MARFSLIFAIVLVVYLAVGEAGVRAPRSPQFGHASASATSFGGNRYQRPGVVRPGFGGNIGRPSIGRGPQLGLNRPGQGATINIAKSVSISTGGSGTSLSKASATSGSRG